MRHYNVALVFEYNFKGHNFTPVPLPSNLKGRPTR
jgi:hypothetical protein